MARSKIPPAFFSPPSLPQVSRPPDWVLVDKMAYIAKRENATTVKGPASGGEIVEVSFCLADPPAISYMCVHCADLVGRTDLGFYGVPTVVSAEGAFVLLEISLSHDHGRRDYFVYKAGTRKPQLSCLPSPFPLDICPWEIGILPLGGGDGNSGFIVAALVPRFERAISKTGPPFDLLLFSAGAREWRTVVPQLDPSCSCKKLFSHSSSKVIVIGGGFLGWVDVWRGILLCNVLDERPVLRLIPLPKPRIARTWKSNPEVVRGITSNGDNQLSFVEIQLPKFPSDDLRPSQYDTTLSDSDSDSDSGTGGPYYPSHLWKATTWKRTLFSLDGDHWSEDCTSGSDDILEGDPTCSVLLPQLWDAEDGKLNLYCTAPVLSVHDEGVVYMISELLTSNSDGKEAWVAAFDLRNKRLKALAPFSSKRTSTFENRCSPCSFSKYLREVPAGLELSVVDRVSRGRPMDFFVLLLLSLQDRLIEFAKSSALESKGAPSLHSMRTKSLLTSIRVVYQFAPRDGKDKVIQEAMATCMRLLGYVQRCIALEPYSDQPLERRMGVLNGYIYSSHGAIDRLLQLLAGVTSEESCRSRDACSSLGVESGLGLQLENTYISEYDEEKN